MGIVVEDGERVLLNYPSKGTLDAHKQIEFFA